MRPSSSCSDSKTSSEGPEKKHENRPRCPCRKDSASEKSGGRRAHRVFHHDNETPLIVQAALLPIEISKPTTPPSTQSPLSPELARRISPIPLEPDFQFQRSRPVTLPSAPPSRPVNLPSSPPSLPPPPPPPPPPPTFLPPPPQPTAVDNIPQTTIPPPATLQEPTTSTPYGVGQPPAKTTVPHPTSQCQPYSNQQQTSSYSQPQPQNQTDSQISQPEGQSYQSYQAQPFVQPAAPQPRPRPQTQPNSSVAPQAVNSSQSQPQPRATISPRPPLPGGRFSDSGVRHSSISQPYSPQPSQRITTYPPSKPVLPMPKPPPQLQQMLQQQEEQRKQQQLIFLQHQLQTLQTIQQQRVSMAQQQGEVPQSTPEADPDRESESTIADSESNDQDRELDDTETQSDRPSLKQRPRPNKRIANRISPLRSTPPQAQPMPQRSLSTCGTSPGASNNAPQRPGISTVPPHPYGTIVPWFSAQNAFHASHHPTANQPAPQMHRPTLACSTQPPDPVQKPITSNFGTNISNKPPQHSSRQSEFRNEYAPKPPEAETGSHDDKTPETNAPQSNQQPPQQTQGIQARLSHAQPIHSPALQTTHVVPLTRYQNTSPQNDKQEDLFVDRQSRSGLNQAQFSQRSSYTQQQQSYQQWQQQHRQPQTFVQLGTFPPTMATFARPPAGAFVANITDRPLKLSSTPPCGQSSQLCPQSMSNVGVGIRTANSCPGEIRMGSSPPSVLHNYRQGSPHGARARSAGRISPSDSTANVWGSNSNPHHLP